MLVPAPRTLQPAPHFHRCRSCSCLAPAYPRTNRSCAGTRGDGQRRCSPGASASSSTVRRYGAARRGRVSLDTAMRMARALHKGGAAAAAAQVMQREVDAELAPRSTRTRSICWRGCRFSSRATPAPRRRWNCWSRASRKPAYSAALVAHLRGGDDSADRLTPGAYRPLRQLQALRDTTDCTKLARLPARAGLLAGDERNARATPDCATLTSLGLEVASRGDVAEGRALMADHLAKDLRAERGRDGAAGLARRWRLVRRRLPCPHPLHEGAPR